MRIFLKRFGKIQSKIELCTMTKAMKGEKEGEKEKRELARIKNCVCDAFYSLWFIYTCSAFSSCGSGNSIQWPQQRLKVEHTEADPIDKRRAYYYYPYGITNVSCAVVFVVIVNSTVQFSICRAKSKCECTNKNNVTERRKECSTNLPFSSVFVLVFFFFVDSIRLISFETKCISFERSGMEANDSLLKFVKCGILC